MVHGVDLHGGRPRWYRNRWVRSPEASAHLDESPVPHEDGGWYPGSGNTNVFAHAGRILAVTEGSLPYELAGDLDTVATRNFGGPLPAGINAHPKFDPNTGEMHVMSYGFDNPALRYHVIDICRGARQHCRHRPSGSGHAPRHGPDRLPGRALRPACALRPGARPPGRCPALPLAPRQRGPGRAPAPGRRRVRRRVDRRRAVLRLPPPQRLRRR